MTYNALLLNLEMEIVRLKQQLFLQKEEIAMLKTQKRTRMPKSISAKSKAMKGLKSSKSYRNGYNGNKSKLKTKSNISETLKKSKTGNLRSSSHTFDSGTTKNNSKKKFGKFTRNKSAAGTLPSSKPKLGNALSALAKKESR